MRHGSLVLSTLVLSFGLLARAEDPQTLAFVSGGSTGKLFRIDAGGPVQIFSAGQGFQPSSIVLDGNGRIFSCDPSNSEVHLLQQDAAGTWTRTTIFDKDTAVPPSPEQPVGCTFVGSDLYLAERSGSGDLHGIWALRDAATTPTSGPFGAPELVASIVATGGAKLTDLTYGPNAVLYAAVGNRILSAQPPDYDVFTVLASGLPSAASGIAVNSVGEIFVAFANLGVVRAFDTSGASCGTYATLGSLKPKGLQFDLADKLYIAAPKLNNDRLGDVFVVAPSGGPSTHQCDLVPPLVTAVCGAAGSRCQKLASPATDAQVDVALPPSAVSITVTFGPDPDPEIAKLCSSLLTLDPEFLNGLADPTCDVTITCREMPLAEFEERTDVDFPNTSCMDVPGADGHCIEIGVAGAECFGGITDAQWMFFVSAAIGPEDRPGWLYAEEQGPGSAPFMENILTGFAATVPDLPNDPVLTGRRDEFGSAVVGVIHAPNRPPVADAGDDVVVALGPGTVTLDASGSFDPDPIDADTLEFLWSGPAIPAGAEDDVAFQVEIEDLGLGQHAYTLTVTDSGLFSDEGSLSSTDGVTVTVESAGSVLIDGIVADPSTLWPPNHAMVPVVLEVDASSAGCGAEPVSCSIVAVTSSDPVGGPGDPDTGDGGATFPDWVVTGPLTVDLRAERSQGGDSEGDARIYTIVVACACGSTTPELGTVEVRVFASQGD